MGGQGSRTRPVVGRMSLSLKRLGMVRGGKAILRPALEAPVAFVGAVSQAATIAAAATSPPAANLMLFALVSARNSVGALASIPTIGDDVGLSWSLVHDTYYDDAANPRIRGALYVAHLGASLSPITLTGACSGAGNMNLDACTIKYGTISTNIIDGLSATGDPNPTLPINPAPDSLVLGCMVDYGGSSVIAPTGYTQIRQSNNTSNSLRGQLVYCLTSAPASPAWSTSATKSFAQLIEITR